MGRLTQRLNGEAWFDGKDGKMYSDSQGRYFGEAADKLAHYEDLEEQGRLIEQKHGHWIYKHDEEGNTGNAQYECSECGAGDLHAKSQEVPYCWKCGAKMELKELEGDKE